MEHITYDYNVSIHHILVTTVIPQWLEKAYEFWVIDRLQSWTRGLSYLTGAVEQNSRFRAVTEPKNNK